MSSAFGRLDLAEWERGAAWFNQLPFNVQFDVAADLNAEEFDWRSWFTARPSLGFLEGIEAAHLEWETKRRAPAALGGLQTDCEVGFARQSLHEERKAIRDYTARLKRTRDPKLRRVLKHALKEEREHAVLLASWLKGR